MCSNYLCATYAHLLILSLLGYSSTSLSLQWHDHRVEEQREASCSPVPSGVTRLLNPVWCSSLQSRFSSMKYSHPKSAGQGQAKTIFLTQVHVSEITFIFKSDFSWLYSSRYFKALVTLYIFCSYLSKSYFIIVKHLAATLI